MAQPRWLENYQINDHHPNDFDQLSAAFEWEIPDQFNIAEYVCDRWAEDKSKVGVFVEGDGAADRATTFWQLRRQSDMLANYLSEQGVARGDRVIVNLGQRPENLVANLAVWKLGGISVPTSTLFGEDGLRYRIEDCRATACIVDDESVETVRAIQRQDDPLEVVVHCDDGAAPGEDVTFADAIDSGEPSFDPVQTAADEDAMIFYTSGTTGKPKGVVHGHEVVIGSLPYYSTSAVNLHLDSNDLFWTPVEWAWAGVFPLYILGSLFHGVPVLAFDGDRFDPADAYRLTERYGVTVSLIPPTALRRMRAEENAEGYDVGSMRVISAVGEQLGEHITRWASETFGDVVIHEGYGQSEAIAVVGECAALSVNRPGSMGKAMPGQEMAILDPTDPTTALGPDETGEIAFRYQDNPACFSEYWEKPSATEEKFQEGWLLTEDLGRQDEDGYVTFVSRKDDVIITSGYRIGPEEIEDYLADHATVFDAAVIGVPDEDRGEIPKAYVVLVEGETPSDALRQTLIDHVKEGLAKYKHPREIEFVPELPRTTTGKVQRGKLGDSN